VHSVDLRVGRGKQTTSAEADCPKGAGLAEQVDRLASKALPCGDTAINKNPVNETEVHPKIHTISKSMNPVNYRLTPTARNPLVFSQAYRLGRKAKPCSAEAAPSGQPASPKVTPFGRNPQSQAFGLLR